MPIISSEFIVGPEQADGHSYITEHHTANNGQIFSFEYLSGEADPAAVMNARAALLNSQFEEKAAVQAMILGTVLPLTVYEFLKRFTMEERIAIRTAAKSDVGVEDFMDLLNKSGAVYMTNSDVQEGLLYLVRQGYITVERASVIGAL